MVKTKRRKILIKGNNQPVMTVLKEGTKESEIAYLLVANRQIGYGRGKKSRIVYIGKSEKGIKRAASSIARKALSLFRQKETKKRGVKKLNAYIYSGTSKPWVMEAIPGLLERALLIGFYASYGTTPIFNKVGHKFLRKDKRREKKFISEGRGKGSVFRVFKRKRILNIIKGFEGFG